MSSRRNSTNITPGRTPPRSTSSSIAGTRPLSLVATHQAFRISTARMPETESLESEIPPQELSPVPPPRPVPSSYLPPGNSGLRRQSTRRGTHETFRPTLDEHNPSRPPSMPVATTPQLSEPSPSIPTHRLAPGDGNVCSAPVTSPQRESSLDYSTADYTYRFDTMPSPRLDSGPPHYEPADISGGIHAKVWPTYNKVSQEFDEKRLAKWNADLDVLLIFVSLGVGQVIDSDRIDTFRSPSCFLPSSRHSSSGPSMTWDQTIINRRCYSFTSC